MAYFSGGLGIQSAADRVFLVELPSLTSFCNSATLLSRSITFTHGKKKEKEEEEIKMPQLQGY